MIFFPYLSLGAAVVGYFAYFIFRKGEFKFFMFISLFSAISFVFSEFLLTLAIPLDFHSTYWKSYSHDELIGVSESLFIHLLFQSWALLIIFTAIIITQFIKNRKGRSDG